MSASNGVEGYNYGRIGVFKGKVHYTVNMTLKGKIHKEEKGKEANEAK